MAKGNTHSKYGYKRIGVMKDKKGRIVDYPKPTREDIIKYKDLQQEIKYLEEWTEKDPDNAEYKAELSAKQSELDRRLNSIIMGIEKLVIGYVNNITESKGVIFYNPDDYAELIYLCLGDPAVRALEKYDPYHEKTATFQSYAQHEIRGFIIHWIDHDMKKSSKYYCKNIHIIEKKRSEFYEKNGRMPSNAELEQMTPLSATAIRNAGVTAKAMQSVSWEDALDQGSKEEEATWAVEDDAISNAGDVNIGSLLNGIADNLLTETEEYILSKSGFKGYYEGEMKDKDIAKELGMTKTKVQQIKCNAERKLRTCPALKKAFFSSFDTEGRGQKMLRAEPINFLNIEALEDDE